MAGATTPLVTALKVAARSHPRTAWRQEICFQIVMEFIFIFTPAEQVCPSYLAVTPAAVENQAKLPVSLPCH
jgi:hypothetical protein